MEKGRRSEDLSLEAGRTVRGVDVRRLPIGGYLRALGMLEEAPRQLMRACFPGLEPEAVLRALRNADRALLVQMALRALEVAPAFVVRLFAEVSGIAEARLLEDADIGLDGLLELMEAWAEVNGLGNFIRRLRAWAGQSPQAASFRRPGGGCSD